MLRLFAWSNMAPRTTPTNTPRNVWKRRMSLSKAKLHRIRSQQWSYGSVLDHRSLPSVFESLRAHIWRAFDLRLCFVTFGDLSTSGGKTSIIIIIIIIIIEQLLNWSSELKYVRILIVVYYCALYMPK